MNHDVAVSKTGMRRLLAVFGVALMALVVVAVSLFCTPTTTQADNEPDDISFYKIASAASGAYNQASTDTEKHIRGTDLNMWNAGAYLGFLDKDSGVPIIGAVTSFLSSSSQSNSYEALSKSGVPGVYEYAQYGHALMSLGLDSSANQALDIAAILRVLAGGLLIIVYTLALAAELLFSIFIGALKVLNPFAWFGSLVSDSASRFFGQGTTAYRYFSSVTDTIGTMYGHLVNLGPIIATFLFFVSIGVALIMWKKTEGVGSILRKFFTRIAFVVLAIPLLGATYTAAVEAAQPNGNSNFAANEIIASTLFDFESWAGNKQLNLADTNVDITMDLSSINGAIDYSKTTNPQLISKALNKVNDSGVLLDDGSGNQVHSDWAASTLRTTKTPNSTIIPTYSMILRYMSSTYYTPAAFETKFKAQHLYADNDSARGGKDRKAYADMLKEHGDTDKWLDDSANQGWPEGADYVTDGNTTGSSQGDAKSGAITFRGGGSADKGLSTLAMYNYLTSKFTDSDVVTFSNGKATSGLVLETHHSVNAIGDGGSKALYILNAMSSLLFLAVIGLVYGLGLVISTIMNGLRLIVGLPFAMLGNFKAMGKVFMYGVIMIIEVFFTAVMYNMILTVYMGFIEAIQSSILRGFISGTSSGGSGVGSVILPGFLSASGAVGVVTTIGTLLIMTIINIWLMVKMIKLRKGFLHTIEEFFAGIIDRMFPGGGGAGQALSDSQKPGAMAKLRNAAAAGAGAAVGAKAAKAVGDKFGKNGKNGENSNVIDMDKQNGDSGGGDADEDGFYRQSVYGNPSEGLSDGGKTDELPASRGEQETARGQQLFAGDSALGENRQITAGPSADQTAGNEGPSHDVQATDAAQEAAENTAATGSAVAGAATAESDAQAGETPKQVKGENSKSDGQKSAGQSAKPKGAVAATGKKTAAGGQNTPVKKGVPRINGKPMTPQQQATYARLRASAPPMPGQQRYKLPTNAAERSKAVDVMNKQAYKAERAGNELNNMMNAAKVMKERNQPVKVGGQVYSNMTDLSNAMKAKVVEQQGYMDKANAVKTAIDLSDRVQSGQLTRSDVEKGYAKYESMRQSEWRDNYARSEMERMAQQQKPGKKS